MWTAKSLLPVLLVLLALNLSYCQNTEDEFNANDDEFERDNEFPVDNAPVVEPLEGSGTGPLAEDADSESNNGEESSIKAPLVDDQNVELQTMLISPVTPEDSLTCPEVCTCTQEGDKESVRITVDCSAKDLTELPDGIDTRVTVLYLQNNKLTEIPKKIADFKDLQELNVNDNLITDFEFGSVSELSKLQTLTASNNKLLVVPHEIKNSLGLTSLTELDIGGGNDIRETMTLSLFDRFTSLKKLTIPTSTPELIEDLCHNLQDSLEVVCTVSCTEKRSECPDSGINEAELDLLAILPEDIDEDTDKEGEDPNIDQPIPDDSLITIANENNNESSNTDAIEKSLPPILINAEGVEVTPVPSEDSTKFSFRDAVYEEDANNLNRNKIALSSGAIAVEAVEETNTDSVTEHEVNVGASGMDPTTGGVDKSVIGMIVAAMVLVVAGVTIKKNWKSIKNKFSSQPRPASNRPDQLANGNTPEEVPLQDKSPV